MPPPHCCRLGSRSPLLGLCCGTTVVRHSHTPSCGIFFTSHLATPCTKGTNASDVAARVSQPCQQVRRRASLGQGWGSVRDQQGSPSSRRDNIRAFNFLLSTFSATPGGPKGSTPSGNAGELPGNEVYGRMTAVYGRHLTV